MLMALQHGYLFGTENRQGCMEKKFEEEFGILKIFRKRFESISAEGLPDNKSWWIRKPICSQFG